MPSSGGGAQKSVVVDYPMISAEQKVGVCIEPKRIILSSDVKNYFIKNLYQSKESDLFLFKVIDDQNKNLHVYRNAGVATTTGAKALPKSPEISGAGYQFSP
jgi:hypothetical protein